MAASLRSGLLVAAFAAIGTAALLVHGDEALSRLHKTPSSFAAVAVRSMPAVVNVSATQMVKSSDLEMSPEATGEDAEPLAPGGTPPAPGAPQQVEQRSLGSGFFISGDGLIATNHHVVANAVRVTVRLASDDRTGSNRQYPARVVGTDSKTDLALIKIDPDERMQSLSLGDSSRLMAGDWIVAIGNPFGLNQTVTAGIVSGTGRVIGQGPYDDLIQTDASINPGSSGGPLLNADGEVVGISVAIVGGPVGSVGIGFGTPSNLARDVLDQLRSRGKVVRGWIGTSAQPVTVELAESLHLPEQTRGGALVADVNEGGPANQGGLRRGDVVLSFDGRPVRSWRDFPTIVASTEIGKEAEALALRDGSEEHLKIKVAEAPEETDARQKAEPPAKHETGELGASVQHLTAETARKLGTDQSRGLLVTQVQPGSLADEAGIQPGDVIQEINRRPVKTSEELKRAVTESESGRTLLLLVFREGSTIFLTTRKG